MIESTSFIPILLFSLSASFSWDFFLSSRNSLTASTHVKSMG